MIRQISNCPPVKNQLSLLTDLNVILPSRKSIDSDGEKLITCFNVWFGLFVCVTFSLLFFFLTSIGKVEHFTGSNIGKTEIRIRDLNFGTSCTTNSLCDLDNS